MNKSTGDKLHIPSSAGRPHTSRVFLHSDDSHSSGSKTYFQPSLFNTFYLYYAWTFCLEISICFSCIESEYFICKTASSKPVINSRYIFWKVFSTSKPYFLEKMTAKICSIKSNGFPNSLHSEPSMCRLMFLTKNLHLSCGLQNRDLTTAFSKRKKKRS